MLPEGSALPTSGVTDSMFLFATSGALPALIIVLGLVIVAMMLGALFKLTRLAADPEDEGEQIDLPRSE